MDNKVRDSMEVQEAEPFYEEGGLNIELEYLEGEIKGKSIQVEVRENESMAC